METLENQWKNNGKEDGGSVTNIHGWAWRLAEYCVSLWGQRTLYTLVFSFVYLECFFIFQTDRTLKLSFIM